MDTPDGTNKEKFLETSSNELGWILILFTFGKEVRKRFWQSEKEFSSINISEPRNSPNLKFEHPKKHLISINLTQQGTKIRSIEEYSKVLFPNEFKFEFSENSTNESLLQFLNAKSPTSTKLEGNRIFWIDEFPKECFPIETRFELFSKEIFFNCLQSAKANSPIEVTLEGTTTDSIKVLENEYFSIDSSFAFFEKMTNFN